MPSSTQITPSDGAARTPPSGRRPRHGLPATIRSRSLPLGLREAGVEKRDAVAEARAEAAERLRRERDPARGQSRRGLRRAQRRTLDRLGLPPVAPERTLPPPPQAGPRSAPAYVPGTGEMGRRSLAARAEVAATSCRSPRRFACCGAMSASARAGVEPCSPRARARSTSAGGSVSARARPRPARRRAAPRRRRRRPPHGAGRCRRGSRERPFPHLVPDLVRERPRKRASVTIG